MAERYRLLLSCEHGGNEVPAEFRSLFAGQEEVLASHRAYDLGMAELTRLLARRLEAPAVIASLTRLLVDHNRSPHNTRALFSAFSRSLPAATRARLVREHYLPYRRRVEEEVRQLLSPAGVVVHLAVHSFTPELGGEVRNADLGLLYDPSRPLEALFCRRWQRLLADLAPEVRVRRNYPYRGASDAMVTWLRRRLPADRYLGLELEVNQSFPLEGGAPWEELQRLVARTLDRMVKIASGAG